MSILRTGMITESLSSLKQGRDLLNADGQSARRLSNASGEYSIDEARAAFERKLGGAGQIGGSDARGIESSGRRRRGARGRRGNSARRDSGSGGGASAGLMLLCGVGLGAALMYIFDPERGRGRRAYLREQFVGASNRASERRG